MIYCLPSKIITSCVYLKLHIVSARFMRIKCHHCEKFRTLFSNSWPISPKSVIFPLLYSSPSQAPSSAPLAVVPPAIMNLVGPESFFPTVCSINFMAPEPTPYPAAIPPRILPNLTPWNETFCPVQHQLQKDSQLFVKIPYSISPILVLARAMMSLLCRR